MGKTVKDRYVIMALYIKDTYHNKIYGRKYYAVQYEDDSEQILLTTNEPVTGYDKYDLEENFILIDDFEQLIDGFESTELRGLIIPSEFNGIPKYIYYNIIFIHGQLKPMIYSHLNDSMNKVEVINISFMEKEQINKWNTYLTI